MNTMSTPKVTFTQMPIEMEVEMLYEFLFHGFGGWNKYILWKHKDLKNAYQFKAEADQRQYIHDYIVRYRKENKEEIKRKQKEFSQAWKKVEKKYFQTIQEIMDISWPNEDKNVYALLSINPINPRFLEQWDFSLFYDQQNLLRVFEIIMHECCHFLYFHKWIEVFPKANKKTFDAPYIEWFLSELAAPIILNDPRMQKILKKRAQFYPEHRRIKIGVLSAPTYFNQIYKLYQEKEDGFTLFLKHAYKDIKKHKKIFVAPMK